MTLDPLVRQVRLPDHRELLVSDTVGFIDRLPHALVAAFRATLEEVAEADLVLHVIDAASPERERQMAAVRRVLEEVGAADVPMVDVYNKIDTITAGRTAPARATPTRRRRSFPRRPGSGVDELLQMIASRLALDTRRVTITFDSGKEFDRQQIARLYRVARVISHVATNGRVVIEADVPRRFIERLTAAWNRRRCSDGTIAWHVASSTVAIVVLRWRRLRDEDGAAAASRAQVSRLHVSQRRYPLRARQAAADRPRLAVSAERRSQRAPSASSPRR